MTPRELLTRAADRQEVLIGYMPWWSMKDKETAIRDWLRLAAEQPWDRIMEDPQHDDRWLGEQPVIRMARIVLGTVAKEEL